MAKHLAKNSKSAIQSRHRSGMPDMTPSQYTLRPTVVIQPTTSKQPHEIHSLRIVRQTIVAPTCFICMGRGTGTALRFVHACNSFCRENSMCAGSRYDETPLAISRRTTEASVKLSCSR